MKDILDTIQHTKGAVRLSKEKKSELRGRLLQFMRAGELVREGNLARQSIQRSPNTLLSFKRMTITAIIAIVALVGGGTSLAAQDSLPGDFLYVVKVNVNEKVALAFKASAEAKAEYEADLALRRLEEAAELAAQGEIDAETRTEIESRFEGHAGRAESRIADLELKGKVRAAADVASRFEAELRTKESVLAEIETKAEELRSLRLMVGVTLKEILGTRTKLETDIASSSDVSTEAKVEVKAAAEGKLTAAENFIASTRKYVESKKAVLGAEAAANAEARLKLAEDLVLDARAKIEAEAYGEAFNLGNEAIRAAQEARALIEARINLNVDVNLRVRPYYDMDLPSIIDEDEAQSIKRNLEIQGGVKSGTSTQGEIKLDVGF